MNRARLEYPGVKERKMGVLPNGLTMGNKADTTRRQLLKTSQIAESGMSSQDTETTDYLEFEGAFSQKSAGPKRGTGPAGLRQYCDPYRSRHLARIRSAHVPRPGWHLGNCEC